MTEFEYAQPKTASTRTYLLDINPHHSVVSLRDVANRIDGRWIDTTNGKFIDITALHFDEVGAVQGRASPMFCKDGHRYEKQDIHPLQQSDMEGVRVHVPAKSDKILSEDEGPVGSAKGLISSAVGSFASRKAPAAPWLLRALQVATQGLEVHMPTASTKVVSQVLPVNAADQRMLKSYEIICDYLQHILPEPRYISITHALAVSPGQGVEHFPKSRSATPGFDGGDGYLGDQTIFTHAAEVAVHHEFRGTGANLPLPPQRHVMSAEANLILLERYIPPTATDEMSDFFSADSSRSYLADRIRELAVEHGSLLLVYPTRTGGQTFARRCVAPVLDPLLRETTILRNLSINAAERLGKMRALDSMLQSDDMRNRLQPFCTALNASDSMKKSRSSFVLAHSETAQVVLDRDTWMTWFVEQEQPRMKQDLVDYHKGGGTLPKGNGGRTEITAGMLTGEIVEGLRKHMVAAGNGGIEVGIFVIRRVRRPVAG
ncbi:hypothetical protein LTS08_008770 [Lithohypha guttulata]|nr:hypothetical protein LTS08_008770 [Lithohypha guttulata]